MRHTKNFHPDRDKNLLSHGDKECELAIATFIVLEDVRRHFKEPIKINCAVRLWFHNKDVGGSIKSFHLPEYGASAVDFVVNNVPPSDVQDYLKSAPYTNLLGIGCYNTFTHVDTRGYKARW